MVKVEKNNVTKEVAKELVSAYVKAGWKIVENKKPISQPISQPQDKKVLVKND